MRLSAQSRPARSARRRPSAGTFFARVYALVARVPPGRVVTYGGVARLLGAPRSARIVGWAMHGNPHGPAVPCHRVVQHGGSLSPNYCLQDPLRQRRLLEAEGVTFTLDGRVDLARHEWRPRTSAECQVPSESATVENRDESAEGRVRTRPPKAGKTSRRPRGG